MEEFSLEDRMADDSIILAAKPHEQDKEAKRYDAEKWAPRLYGVQYATGEEQREISNSFRNNEVAGAKWKQRSVVDTSGGESKIWTVKNNTA